MPFEATRATLGALRATRDCHRLATAILQSRIDTLATVSCATCGRPIAVAVDPGHPAAAYEGRVICRICLRASQVAEDLAWGLDESAPEPTLECCAEELEQWARDGWVELPPAPDPRPTLGEWVARMFRSTRRRD